MRQIGSIGEYVPVRSYAMEQGIKPVTLQKHIERHGIPTVKFGWNVLVKLSDIQGYRPKPYHYRNA
jgi:hypothetical protein